MADSGCFFRSLQSVAEEYYHRNLTADDINDSIKALSSGDHPAIGSPSCPFHVNSANAVMNDAFERLRNKEKREPKITSTLDIGEKGQQPDYSLITGENKLGYHTRLGDINGNLLWDPAPGTPVENDTRRYIYINNNSN